MLRHLMLVPSTACPAECNYCFGPHEGGSAMKSETVEATVRWIQALDVKSDSIDLTFHGGEPLTAGIKFYRMALPILKNGLAHLNLNFGIQSNLWLLSDQFCNLFQEYDFSIGTSLDGPETINDPQRGAGYYQRTMDGIHLSKEYGMTPGCICTFTRKSAKQAEKVFEFFAQEGLGFNIHAALPPINNVVNEWVLSPEAHGRLMVEMLKRYLPAADRIRISSLDSICQSISNGKGSVCTFDDCLGKYLAVDPQGWIYSCQRFVGKPEYQLGNVHECPSMDDLSKAPFWNLLQHRQEHIEEECGECVHLDYCRGGCPYNVLAVNKGSFEYTLRDPHCKAYQHVFGYVIDKALDEVFSEENLNSIVLHGTSKHGLMHKGRLLQIMRGDPHPQKVAGKAREAVSAVVLAESTSPADGVKNLEQIGLVQQPARALQSLTALQNRLDTQSKTGLMNAYFHVTNNCNLRCSHCYADSEPGRSPVMDIDDLAGLVNQASALGFKKAVVTGGEPLMHPNPNGLLDTFAVLRGDVKPMLIVLRTNLAYRLTASLTEKLIYGTDKVIVSIDGDGESHDMRRGPGTYARTVANLRTLMNQIAEQGLINNPLPTQVGITAVLPANQVDEKEGAAVRALGQELGITVRFKAVLPIGRGEELSLIPDFYTSIDDGQESLANTMHPASTCGLGMNLYVGPTGDCFPCYALMSSQNELGNALEEGLAAILERNDRFRQVTVDSNKKCQQCAMRYLCGGFCRAWSNNPKDPDAPPLDCSALYTRASNQLKSALKVLDIPLEHWTASGLAL